MRRPAETMPPPALRRWPLRLLLPLTMAAASTGCTRLGGLFEPASIEALRVARLFWVMAIGSGLIWLLVVAIALYASRSAPYKPAQVRLFLFGGGVVFPLVVLSALLVYGLRLLGSPPSQVTPLHVEVTGQQWWWRVAYPREGSETVITANELRLPRGEPVTIALRSRDVIHSFWVPALGGKLDMIPGRDNRLVIQPTRLGVFRGACAEYCGRSHANMGLFVEVMEPDAFRAWLEAQARPAQPEATAQGQRGEVLFTERGCALCHTVRGTPARGDVGPDLTHVASRHSIAAGLLPNTDAAMRRWIRHADRLKPRTLMPSQTIGDEDLDALVAYLGALR